MKILSKVIILFALTSIVFTTTSCNKKNEFKNSTVKIFEYIPNYLNKNIRKKTIYIDSIENYNQLLYQIEKITCEENKHPLLTIKKQNSEYRLFARYICPNESTIYCYPDRSEISIEPDSIHINAFYSTAIDSIDVILLKHILNPNKNHEFADSPKEAFISFSADSAANINTVKNTLLKILNTFNKINKNNGDSLPLNINFQKELFVDFLRNLPPPPPPIVTGDEIELIN